MLLYNFWTTLEVEALTSSRVIEASVYQAANAASSSHILGPVKSLGIGFPLLSYRSSATTSCLQCLCPTPLERLTWDAATCCWICLLLALDFVDIPSIQLTGHGFLEHRGIISACRSPSGNCMALLMHYWGFGFVSFSQDLVNIFLGFADFCHKRNYRCI